MESVSSTLVTAEQRIIYCDAEPFIPRGFVIVRHLSGGNIVWDKNAQAKEGALWFSEGQKRSRTVEGESIREELSRLQKPVLNACVLDYLYAHPDARPEGWWKYFVLFWGTIYEEVHSHCECVRYLCSDNGKSYSGTVRLNIPLNSFNPAALRAI